MAARRSKRDAKRQAGWFELVWTAIVIGMFIRDMSRRDYSQAFNFVFVTFGLWFFRRIENSVIPVYEFGEASISYKDGRRRLRHKWSNIEWYRVSPATDVPDLMQVRFHVENARFWNMPPAFVFDPQEIDERKLIHILETRLPQKERREHLQQKRTPQGPWA